MEYVHRDRVEGAGRGLDSEALTQILRLAPGAALLFINEAGLGGAEKRGVGATARDATLGGI